MKTPQAVRQKQKLYQREYRRSAKGAAKVLEYNRKTVDHRVARNKARRLAKKIYGDTAIINKDIHHKDGNPLNNSRSNLGIRRRNHEGGPKKRR